MKLRCACRVAAVGSAVWLVGCGSRSDLSFTQGEGRGLGAGVGSAPGATPTQTSSIAEGVVPGDRLANGSAGQSGGSFAASSDLSAPGTAFPPTRGRRATPGNRSESDQLTPVVAGESSDRSLGPDRRRPVAFAPDGPSPRVALGAPFRCEGAALSVDATLQALLEAVGQRPARASSLRYVSIGNELHGDCVQRFAGTDADWARVGVTALLNSLSTNSQLVLPTPLDPGMILLEIDLADYGWDAPVTVAGIDYPDAWAALATHSRQGQRFVGPQAEQLRALTGGSMPWLLANDLVTTATQPSLYYELLRLPNTLDGLMTELDLPGPIDLSDGNWAVAGTAISRISRQERKLARRAATGRTQVLWQGMQYSPTTESEGIFLDPLGSRADATVILFALPNGLPAYFSANAEGTRVEAAEFLFDTSANDFVATAPLSCMGCHGGTNVVLPVHDEVRELYVSGFAAGTSLETEVLNAYPSFRQMATSVQEDNQLFERAAQRLGFPDGEEPISRSVQGRDRDMPISVIASELFLDEPALVERLDRMPEAVRVAAGSGYVSRLLFDQVYLQALCAATDRSRNRPESCL